MLKPLTVWITTNCGKFCKHVGIPDHLACLLRNLSAGQEATVRTRHETMIWFKIEKGVCQGMTCCILSLCLFNLYAELLWLVTQSCLILCDPLDPIRSPPGSSVHRILQARILEWVVISFSNIQSTSCEMLNWMNL